MRRLYPPWESAAFAVAAWCIVSLALAQAPAVPKHLALARALAQNVTPENNRYVLGRQVIRFPDDPGSSGYAVRADCSGFLLALFARAGYATQSQMIYLDPASKRKRPASEDFVASIEQGKGFARIAKVDDIRPGDLLAHAMLDARDQAETATTGHVFLIDSTPRRILSRKPVVPGTRQFEVSIIDTSNEYVGDDDTRRRVPGQTITGVGAGTIRLFVDSSGQVVGWARTYRDAKFFSYDPAFPSDTKRRKAAVGRPLAASG